MQGHLVIQLGTVVYKTAELLRVSSKKRRTQTVEKTAEEVDSKKKACKITENDWKQIPDEASKRNRQGKLD